MEVFKLMLEFLNILVVVLFLIKPYMIILIKLNLLLLVMITD